MAFEREAAIGNLEYAKRWKDRPTDETIDMAIKALKQEPKFIVKSDGTIEQIKNCDDCIFRKEWEKIGKLLSVILKKQTEQEPCEDAISRDAVCNIVDDIRDCISVEGYWAILERLKKLPSVKPQTGHWIMQHRKVNTINYRTGEDVLTGEIHTVKELIRYECDEPYCSECGKRAGDTSGNYCCFCGARMESEQNG